MKLLLLFVVVFIGIIVVVTIIITIIIVIIILVNNKHGNLERRKPWFVVQIAQSIVILWGLNTLTTSKRALSNGR